MNKSVIKFIKDSLKDGLKQCTEPQQHIFKKMYSYKNLEKSIDDVVDSMPEEKLDWALTQIQNTINKNNAGK